MLVRHSRELSSRPGEPTRASSISDSSIAFSTAEVNPNLLRALARTRCRSHCLATSHVPRGYIRPSCDRILRCGPCTRRPAEGFRDAARRTYKSFPSIVPPWDDRGREGACYMCAPHIRLSRSPNLDRTACTSPPRGWGAPPSTALFQLLAEQSADVARAAASPFGEQPDQDAF